MKSFEFEAVVYQGEVYCNEHLPPGVDLGSERVHPIFADSEWHAYPHCCECKKIHNYVNLINTLDDKEDDEDEGDDENEA